MAERGLEEGYVRGPSPKLAGLTFLERAATARSARPPRPHRGARRRWGNASCIPESSYYVNTLRQAIDLTVLKPATPGG